MASDGSLIFDTQIDDSGFKAGLSGLKNTAQTILGGTGAALTAVSAGLLAVGKASADVGSAYEDSLNKVASIADTSVKSIAEISAEVKKLSMETGADAAALNDAVYQAISAGADTAEAANLVETAAKAAKGGFTDTETAVNGLTNVLNTYKMATSEADELANKFLVTQNKGKTSFGELAASIGNVAPTAQSVGMSIDELLSSVASLTANGISTSAAMTGMKAALSNIIAPTAQAQKMAEELGIDFSAAALQSKGWAGFLDELAKATDGDTAKMSKLFGSVEALNSVLILTGNGAGLFNDTLEEMATNTTALEDAYNIMADSLSTDMDKLKASAKVLGSSIYDSISDPLRELAAVGNGYIDQLIKAFEEGGLDGISREIGNVMADALNVVGGYAPEVFKAASDLIISFVEGMEQNSDRAIETAAQIIDIMLDTISKTLPKFAYTAVEILSKLTSEILARLDTVVQSAADIIEALAKGLSDNLPTLVPKAVDAVMKIVDTLIENADKLTEAAFDIIVALADGLTSQETLNNLTEKAPVIIAKLIYALGEVLENIVEFGAQIGYELIRGLSEYDFEGNMQNVYQKLYDVGVNMHKALIEGYNNEFRESNPDFVSNIGSMTKEELKRLQADLTDEKLAVEAAWNEFTESEYIFPEEYIAATNTENAQFLAQMKAEAEREGKEIADYITEKIDDIEMKRGMITDALTKGDYKVIASGQNLYNGAALNVPWADALAKTSEEADNAAASVDTLADSLDDLGDADPETDALYEDFKEFYDNLKLLEAHGDIDSEEFKKRLSERLNSDSRYFAVKYTSFWSEIKDSSAQELSAVTDEMRREWSEIEHLNKLGIDDDEQTQKKRIAFIKKYCPEYSDEYYDFYKAAYDHQAEFDKKSLEATKKTLTEQADIVSDKLSKISGEYKSKYADIKNNISDYKNSLMAVGKTFSVDENTDENGVTTRTVTVSNVAERLQKMRDYHKNMLTLKSMGADASLLREIMDMGAENGAYLAEQLLNDSGFAEFNEMYKQLSAESQKMAEEFYQPEITALNQSVNDQIGNAFADLPEEMQALGKEALADFYSGFISAVSEENFDMTDIVESVNKSFKEGFSETLSGMTAETDFTTLLDQQDYYETGAAAAQSWSDGFNDNVSLNSAAFTTEMSYSGSAAKGRSPEYEKIVLNASIDLTTNLDGKKIAENTTEYQKEFTRRSDGYE